MAPYVEFSPSKDRAADVTLSGDWTLEHLRDIENELQTLQQKNQLNIHADIGHMDTAGALLLSKIAGDRTIKGLESGQQALLDMVSKAEQPEPKSEIRYPIILQSMMGLGKHAEKFWHDFLDLVAFVGETVVSLGQLATHPKKLRLDSINRHIRETGINAIPIVALIAFLISVVLAYQGATQLQRFGAQIFTINMIAISVMREMGVLLTAIMLAGRSGSAFTAEIGVMKVNEEVDAMQIIGVKPFETLVIPRLLALIITLPFLTFIADLLGLLGGGLISYVQMNIGPEQYLARFRDAIDLNDFIVGMIKAPVFGFFIALVGCMRGLQVSGSAESVGRLTTVSVVQSIFLVLLLDALFSILFTKLGI